MVHLEQAQPEQLQELLAFAEEAFRTPEGKVDFPTLLPKLYGPAPTARRCIRCCMRTARPQGCTA